MFGMLQAPKALYKPQTEFLRLLDLCIDDEESAKGTDSMNEPGIGQTWPQKTLES